MSEQEKGWETLTYLVDRLPKGPMLGTSARGERHDAFVFNCGFMVKLLDVLEHAFEQSGLTVDEWNALSEQERYDRVDAFVDKPQEKRNEFPSDSLQPGLDADELPGAASDLP